MPHELIPARSSPFDHRPEEDRFEAFLLRHRRALTEFIFRRTRDYHAAEDLCQESLYRACRSRTSLASPDRIRSWLYSIAYHVTVDWLRSQSAGKRAAAHLERNGAGGHGAPSVDRLLIHREEEEGAKIRARRLWRFVRRLPPIYREVFELRYRTWRPIAQIAHQLAIPESNVKVRLFRARRMLIKAIERSGLIETFIPP